MTLIIDEYSYALHLLEYGFSGYMKWQDLLILAKYYRHLGESTQSISKKLVEYSQKFNSEYNDIVFSDKIESAVRTSKKQNLRIPQPVFITQNELDSMRIVNNYRYEKILFVMLVLSRNNKMFNNNLGGDYYINQKFSTILSLAKVYMRKEERNKLKNSFFVLGLIDAPSPIKIPKDKRDNFKLLFADENSEKILWVKDLNNIVDFYFPYCQSCGKQIDRKSNRQKFCDECWMERNKELQRNWIKSKRNIDVEV